jgi:DNA-directed RNA polymerase specialized sigma24 family protein
MLTATAIIRWKGRNDAPVRMCEFCTDHNVKNRGGYVVSVYPPPDTVQTEPAPRKRVRRSTQEVSYNRETVEAYKDKLKPVFYDILIEAAGTREYKTIGAALGIFSVGTVKSRLNRARAMLGSLIGEQATKPARPVEDSTVLGSG